MNKQIRTHLWMLAGPGSLLAALALLMIHAAYLMARPVWLFGLSLSVLIACWITYLSFKEILMRENLLEKLKSDKEKQAHAIRGTLDETSHLYREKVEKLEEAISLLEEERRSLQVGYKKAHDTAQKEKVRASDLHTSLEDALDALRDAQQLHYLKDEHYASLPKDLHSRHHQLREQFDEKALILDQTRRRLFSLEGQLYVARKIFAEEKLDPQAELDLIQEDLALLTDENRRLEEEIRSLESLISELVRPKEKKGSVKRPLEQMLELQFDK